MANINLEKARLFVKNALTEKGVGVPENFLRLRTPGLRRLLLDNEVAIKVLDGFDERFLPKEEPVQQPTPAPQPPPEPKTYPAKETKVKKPKKPWYRKISVMIFIIPLSLLFVSLAGFAFANLPGRDKWGAIAHALVVIIGVIGFVTMKLRKKPKATIIELETGRVLLLMSILGCLQLIHSADGDPNNSWFRFINEPNWFMVGFAVALMVFLAVVIRLIISIEWKPRSKNVLLAVSIVLGLFLTVWFTFGVGSEMARRAEVQSGLQQGTIVPITTGD